MSSPSLFRLKRRLTDNGVATTLPSSLPATKELIQGLEDIGRQHEEEAEAVNKVVKQDLESRASIEALTRYLEESLALVAEEIVQTLESEKSEKEAVETNEVIGKLLEIERKIKDRQLDEAKKGARWKEE